MKPWVRRVAALAVLAVVAALAAGSMLLRGKKVTAQPAQSMQIAAEQADPLTAFRTERQQLRQKQRSELNEIIHDASTDAETLALARQRLLELMDSETAETTLEGLLNARGFQDALVSVNGSAVYVMVRAERLNRQETAVILDLALRETGATAGNVKILAIK